MTPPQSMHVAFPLAAVCWHPSRGMHKAAFTPVAQQTGAGIFGDHAVPLAHTIKNGRCFLLSAAHLMHTETNEPLCLQVELARKLYAYVDQRIQTLDRDNAKFDSEINRVRDLVTRSRLLHALPSVCLVGGLRPITHELGWAKAGSSS